MSLAAEGQILYEAILQKAASDHVLSGLINAATEYAGMYALSRERQKGCDGMGEAAALKEEFRAALEELITYCIGRGYISDNVKAEADTFAVEFMSRSQTI